MDTISFIDVKLTVSRYKSNENEMNWCKTVMKRTDNPPEWHRTNKQRMGKIAAEHNKLGTAATLLRRSIWLCFFSSLVRVTRFGCVSSVDVAFFFPPFTHFTYITIFWNSTIFCHTILNQIIWHFISVIHDVENISTLFSNFFYHFKRIHKFQTKVAVYYDSI